MNQNQFEKLIADAAKKLPQYEPPGELWNLIETRLTALAGRRSLWQRAVALIKGLSLSRWEPALKYSVIAVTAVFMAFMIWRNFIYEPDPLKAVEKAEIKYIHAIEKLEQQVKKQGSDLDLNLLILYQERLALLDESIAACKRTLQENAENVNARKYLLLAYQEKVVTLKNLLRHKKG